MRQTERTGTRMGELRFDLEQRFGLLELNVTSACAPGHVHDGRSCGLDLVASDAQVPGSQGEFTVDPDGQHAPFGARRAWASGDTPEMVARLAAAYEALEHDPRLAGALDQIDAESLCDDCPTACTLESGVHSPQRAILLLGCGTPAREIANRLLGKWQGTGAELLAVARASVF